jgi:uncharacterized membrane protein YgaE (UPF0421/DUF939 family)
LFVGWFFVHSFFFRSFFLSFVLSIVRSFVRSLYQYYVATLGGLISIISDYLIDEAHVTWAVAGTVMVCISVVHVSNLDSARLQVS